MGTPSEAHGTKVQIGSGGSSETFNDITEISAGPDGGGMSPNILKATVHSQEGEIKRATHLMYEPISFTVLYDSDDTQHQKVVTNAAAKTKTNFKIIGNDNGAQQSAFAAFIGVNFSKNPDGWDEMSVTLEIDGEVTFT